MKTNLQKLFMRDTQYAIMALRSSKTTDLTTARMALRLKNLTEKHQDEVQLVLDKYPKDQKKLEAELSGITVNCDLEPLTFEQLHQAGLTPDEIDAIQKLEVHPKEAIK